MKKSKINILKNLLILSTLLYITVPVLFAEIISVSIQSTNDDAEERSSGSVYIDSSDLELVFDGSSEQSIGMRFNRVMLPSSAIVSNAYIQFTVDEVDTGITNVIVYGENNINPVDFSSQNISSRASTASSVNWSSIPSWSTVGEAGTNQQTPDLTNIVNDIITLAGWESGNSMAFIIKAGSSCSSSACQRTAESYDGTSSSAPKLVVEYTLPTTFYAYNDFTNAMPDSSVNINILANDIAGAGETLVKNTVTVVTSPANGTYSIDAIDGSITYSPNSGFIGTDTFTYTVQNSSSTTSNTAKVFIDVGYIIGDRDFTVRNPEHTRNIRGNYKIGGNINLCTYDEDTGDDPTSTGNAKPWSGQCYQTYSNSHPSSFLDIDSDSSTVNSSSFELDTPANSTVVWAGLYWQGVVHNSDLPEDFMNYQTISGAPQISSNKGLDLTNNTYGAEKVKFKVPGGSYVEVTAQQLDFSDLGYAGFTDVTSMLNSTSPNGVYTVADIKSHQGTETNHGNYAGWSLVVIYENPNENFRNITLFDGFVTVTSSYSGNLVIDGFLTPKTTPINSKLAFFTMDGDNGTNSLHIINESGVSTEVIDPNNSTDSLFNATIQGVSNRNPNVPSARMDLDTIDLVNALGPLETTATLQPRSGGDRYTASFFIMSSELYTPRLCYDYAYSQYGQFFTEDYNPTTSPSIVGDIVNGEPIEVKLYIKNIENSDFIADNLQVSILDINTTQAEYQDESTYVTYPNSLIKTSIPDSDLNVASDNSAVEDITIGVINSLEYFYTYYKLNTSSSRMDMPINARVSYDLKSSPESNLTLNIPYDVFLKDMEICSGSSTYTPGKGIFNVVHNNYYDLDVAGGTSPYYNLPTQVTSREGNFKVISLDVNNTDTLNPVSTIVAVEMIDASAFHDTNASCHEQSSAISPRIWVQFGNYTDINQTSTMFNNAAIQAAINDGRTTLTNGVSPITYSSEFYKNARQNAAFRISYNRTNDGNDDLVKIMPGSKTGTYKINFVELVQNLGQCAKDMDGNPNSSDLVAQWCSNNSDKLTQEDIAVCMECVYGINTKFVCSRDNFSIRPEALMMHINDQNQTNSTSQNILTSGYSGVAGATAPVINIASGYNYNIEVTATNHIDNNASSGYIQSFGSSVGKSAQYLWEPRTSITYGACNDEDNKSVPIMFIDGLVDTNTSVAQVGEYRLSMLDTTWTAVDSDSANMNHHTGSYFLSGLDCMTGSVTQSVNSATLNGCDISSNHTNNDNNLVYNDYNVTFHPYKFDMTGITPSVGLNNNPLTANAFIYMADMSQDKNMSFHLNGNIDAVDFNGTKLSNFVDGCYAKAVTLTINKSAISGAVAHQYRFDNTDITANSKNADMNTTVGTINLNTNDFNKSNSGGVNTSLNLNFNRNLTTAVNPEKITYTTYTTNCSNPAECSMSADLTTKSTDGNLTLDQNITHYYGRTHAARQRYEGVNGTANIYYEAYCFKTVGGNTCDKTLLQNGLNSRRTNDIRWFINENHNSANDGNAGSVTQRNGTIVSATVPTLNNPATTIITYDGSQGLPYKTTMENNASRWLIHDEDDATATRNQFSVEFEGGASSWSGAHETNTTTKDVSTIKTNRRSMW